MKPNIIIRMTATGCKSMSATVVCGSTRSMALLREDKGQFDIWAVQRRK